ncbi:hypothetical protein [Flavivirga sp. 57AJ16]|uniref:hypothetical protein n=1 Tax=Flavivirga sp. 57AJ16 TaxID=3025307 RepID=UPI0023666B86|nr:hypothetical protein [Flavivirga sp. 57AJ16]MDD7885744.1 hypothetical protein [Flavivirga sp. 57AJ16]
MSLTTRPEVTSVNMLNPNGIQTLTTAPISSGLPAPSGGLNLSGLIGSATNVIGAASGIVGTASTLTSLLGFDLQANLSNVKEYGWNSWGASTNPEQELQKLQQIGIPKIKQKLASANASNMAEVLMWIDAYLMYTKAGAKHLMERHSRANSTREANRKVQAFCDELKAEYVTNIISNLRSSGITVTKTSHSMKLHEMEGAPFNFRYFAHEPRLFDSEHVYNVSFGVYVLKDAPKSTPTSSSVSGGSQKDGPDDNDSGLGAIVKIAVGAAISRMIGII